MNSLHSKHSVEILGVRINTFSKAEVFSLVESFTKSNKPHLIWTCNVDHLIKLARDGEFHDIYEVADLVLADGMPLVWISRLFGKQIPERIGDERIPLLFSRWKYDRPSKSESCSSEEISETQDIHPRTILCCPLVKTGKRNDHFCNSRSATRSPLRWGWGAEARKVDLSELEEAQCSGGYGGWRGIGDGGRDEKTSSALDAERWS